MANRTVSVLLQAEVGQYVAGMTKAALATKGLGESAEVNSTKASKGFDLAGRGASLFGLAAAGALVAVVSKSMQFEKSMSAVQAATQASASTMGDLREAAIKAGADTQYSATEAADAITEMAKAGVSTADIMKGGLTGALNLAAAGQIDVAEAAGIASTAMVQFNLQGSQLPHVADLLAAGAGKAMGSVEDMGQALNQAGLLASSTGISIEETTGALSAFASAGLVGSDAGTSFKTMLQALQNPSQTSAALMQELGINAYDAQGNFVGLAALAQQLQGKLGGLTQAQRDQALAQIFGTDAARAATVLYREGAAGIQDWTAKVNDAGYAQRQAAQLTDNLAGDLERLGGSFDTLLISIGSGLQGPLRGLTQMLGGMVDGLGSVVKMFGDLPGPVQAALLVMGGWAVAGDKVKDVAGGVIDKFRALAEEATGAEGAVGGFLRAIGPELAIAATTYLLAEIASGFVSLATAGDDAAAKVKQLQGALDASQGNSTWIDTSNSTLLELRQNLRDAQDTVNSFQDQGWFNRVIWTNPFSSAEVDKVRDAKAAVDEFQDSLKKVQEQQDTVSAATDQLSQRLGISREEVVQLADKYGVDLTGSLDNVYGRFLLARASAEGMAGAQDNAASSSGAFADQMDKVAAAADDAKKQTDAFKLSLDILTGAQVNLAQVESAFYDATRAAEGAVKGLSGSVLDASGDFDQQSEAGSKAQGVLFDVRDAANTYISTMIQQGATSDQARAKDAQLREGFIKSAMQMGVNRQQAENLANQYYGLPPERTTKIIADVAAAQNAVAHTQGMIDNLHGKTVLVSVKADGSVQAILGNYSQSSAGGRIKVGYAEGGYTGPGPKDKWAGDVHAGEVVWSQADIAAHGGVQRVESMRTSRPGYADGGIVVDVDDRPLSSTVGAVKKGMEPVVGYAKALKFAMAQAGKPYIWGAAGPGGYDCCIVGGVRVYGPNGATPISQVRRGDRVFSYVDGRLEVHTVTAAWQSKRQPVFAVRTRNRTVTASANHPFLVLRQVEPSRHVKGGRRGQQTPARYETTWSRLDELQRGDLLVQPRAMDANCKPDASLPSGVPIDADVAWLLGAVVGDGTVTDKGLRLALYGEKREQAASIIESNWGGHCGRGESYGIVISNLRLRDDLDSLGMRVLGPEKRVPESVWQWPVELRRAFLDGYCDADGHRPANPAKHGDRTYHSASRELVEDVRALHIMLGDPASNITTTKRRPGLQIKGKTVKNARDLHSFTVWPGVGRGEVVLRRLPGVAKWLDAADFTVTKVLGIDPQGEQDTWDIEVEGAHNFVADGVVVHNSGFMSAITNAIRGRNPYSRVGSTASFPWAGFAPGYGMFTIGSTKNASGGIGHMAGTLLGVNVESTGNHVRYGSAARGASNGLFTTRAHLAMANGGVIGEPVIGVGTRSGSSYSFAERGPEVVLPTSRESSGAGSSAAGGRSGPVTVNARVFIGNREITDIARVEAEAVLGNFAQTVIQRGAYNG